MFTTSTHQIEEPLSLTNQTEIHTTASTETMDDNTAPTTPGAETSSFTPNETKLICAIMQNLTAEIQVR
jgi:hypothetical protein